MKAILIDPRTKTVEPVETDGGWQHLQQLVRTEGSPVDAVGNRKNGDAVWVDDEGQLKGGQSFFLLDGFGDQPLAGRGVILGTTVAGDSCEPTITIEEVRERVRFGDGPVSLASQLN